jgi:prepilin-type processing-associated H-X9-DG protein
MNMVLGADGTSNTLMLAHKGVRPRNYNLLGSGANDAGWAAVGCCSSSTFPTGKGSGWEHKRYPFWVLQDTNLDQNTNASNLPAEDLISSPHVGGMPALFIDGSVRNLSYSINQGKSSASSPPSSVIELLWSYNDGQVISDPSL